MTSILESRIAILLVFIIFLISMMLVILPTTGQAATVKGSIEFEKDIRTADVASGQPDIVTFKGTVSITIEGIGGGLTDIIVNLTADAGPWSLSLSPTTMVFAPGDGPKSFVLSVSVPEDSLENVTQIVTVSGIIQQVPGSLITAIPPTNGLIEVEQFYRFSVDEVISNQSGNAGDALIYSYSITNQGNGKDIIDVKLLNENELPDWQVGFDLNQFALGVGETKNVHVTVTSPPSKTSGTFYIKLRIRSNSAFFDTNDIIEHEVTMYYTIEGNSGSGGSSDGGSSVPGFSALMVIAACGIVMIAAGSIIRRE